jgi:hypothetical protein
MKYIYMALITLLLCSITLAQNDGNGEATVVILKDALKPGHYEYIEVSLYKHQKIINIKIFQRGKQISHVVEGTDVEYLVETLNAWYDEFKNMKERHKGYYINHEAKQK